MSGNDFLAVQSQTIGQVLNKAKGALALALPKHMDVDRMARIALTTIRRNADLLKCDANSLAAAILEAASLGLEIDSRGLAYLVPYGGEATLIPGYKGLMQLAYRSGKIANIYADVVFKREVEAGNVSITLGDTRTIRHDFDILKSAELRAESPQNPPVAAYAVAVFHDGHRHFEFVDAAEVEKRKGASKAAAKGFLWNKWIEEAWKKTAIRKLCKYLDASPELHRAVSLDEQADAGIKQTFDALDVEFTPMGPASSELGAKLDDEAAKAAAKQQAQTEPQRQVTCPNDLDPMTGDPQKVFASVCEGKPCKSGCPNWAAV
jgi:recombination protein RecT